MHYFARSALSAAVALALPMMASAEETVTQMPEVTVVGAPDNAAAPTYSSDDASLASGRAATSDSASLLRAVPGMSIQTGGGVSGLLNLNGLADDRLRVKVDGMDLISACGNHMNPPLSYIDPTAVGTIKVFAGISPVSAGGDSIGGAIQVESPAPEFAAAGQGALTKGEVGAHYRSNGEAYGANLGATFAGEKLNVTYRGSTAQSDDYKAGGDFKPAGPAAAGRESLDADEVGSTMYKSTNQSLALAARGEKSLTELNVGIQDIPYQGFPNQRMDMTGNDSEQVKLRYVGEQDWGKVQASAYNEHTRHKMQFFDDKLYWYGSNNTPQTNPDGSPCVPAPPSRPTDTTGCAAGMPMDTEGNNTGVVVKADIPVGTSSLVVVGTEAQRYRLDDWWDPSGKGMWPDTFWNISDGQRDRYALFGEIETRQSPQWLTHLGLRYERVAMDTGAVQGYNSTYVAEATAFNAADRKKNDDNVDLTALARVTPGESQTIEFGYAMKTRSPNLYERYTWSTGGMAMRMINWTGDGNGYVGNLDLEPETAHTVRATLGWHDAAREKWEFKIAPYYTYVKDYIDVRRCGPGDTLMASGAVCSTANLTAASSFVYLKFVNEDARLYGVDVSGFAPLADETAIGKFKATGALSYVRGENDTTGDNLYNMMPLNVKLALVHDVSNWTNAIEVEWVDDKTDVSQVRNEMQTEAYDLLHLRSSYKWKQVRLDVGIENVLDEFYNHPLGGAYLGQGKTMSGNDVAWGTPVPGMGRSIYTAINYKF